MRKKTYRLLGVLTILVIAGVSYILSVQYGKYRAEKDREAKIVAENMVKYNHWKSLTEIGQKAAALNRKILISC